MHAVYMIDNYPGKERNWCKTIESVGNFIARLPGPKFELSCIYICYDHNIVYIAQVLKLIINFNEKLWLRCVLNYPLTSRFLHELFTNTDIMISTLFKKRKYISIWNGSCLAQYYFQRNDGCHKYIYWEPNSRERELLRYYGI